LKGFFQNTSSFDLQELEDLYSPFKRRKTKADVARENG
jgi:transcriptional accessory protein Tex/SPT6